MGDSVRVQQTNEYLFYTVLYTQIVQLRSHVICNEEKYMKHTFRLILIFNLTESELSLSFVQIFYE